MLQEATEEFRQATDPNDLWKHLHRQLSRLGITGLIYGAKALETNLHDPAIILDSLPPDYLATKLQEGGLEHDEFVHAGLTQTAPILWDENSVPAQRLADFSPEARRSLDIDWSFGVTTGVTLPMRFSGGLGSSLLGCHAAETSWGEFGRMWQEHDSTVVGIAHAFDVALRRDHMGHLFPLSSEERECLLWLAAGLQQKQIADRLRLTDRQVEKRFSSIRGKMKATTTTQAMASALILGLITP